MKLQIYHIRTYVLLFIVAIAIVSCKKTQEASLLAPGAVYIKEALNTDTLSASINKLSNVKDSIVTVKLQASVKQAAGSGTHTVVFGVDTSEMAAYRAKYGNIPILPASSYFIPFDSGNIAVGTTTSSSAEINIVSETPLLTGVTYVLPIVIKNVDGQATETTGQGQVIYLLIKIAGIDRGTPINKALWKVVSYSSELAAADGPQYVLDNNPVTAWVSITTGTMPQYVTLDMGQNYNLKMVTYQDWASAAAGAAPTQLMIELSTDGSNWTNMGTFTDTAPGTALKYLAMNPVTTARYIRFTVLQVTKLGNFTFVGIAEIGAND